MIAACVVAGLVGLGAEVVYTGLRSVSGFGFARPLYFWAYCAAPPAIWALGLVLQLPWRLLVDTVGLVLVDQIVRIVEGESRTERFRALRSWRAWIAWFALACILEAVAAR